MEIRIDMIASTNICCYACLKEFEGAQVTATYRTFRNGNYMPMCVAHLNIFAVAEMVAGNTVIIEKHGTLALPLPFAALDHLALQERAKEETAEALQMRVEALRKANEPQPTQRERKKENAIKREKEYNENYSWDI